MLGTILLVLALACFIAATFNLASGKINLIACGLALWVLSLLLGTLKLA